MAVVCDVRVVTILEGGYRVFYPPFFQEIGLYERLLLQSKLHYWTSPSNKFEGATLGSLKYT